jgi:exopolysaccharide/PEP-CTERM locus tyrosine autokinase
MGRIEEAIEKLQARDTNRGRPRPPPARAASSDARVDPRNYVYGQAAMRVDPDALSKEGLWPPEADSRRMAEEYQIIKRPLLANASADRDPVIPLANLIMVASALAGEGKTFTCLNLSLSIARERDWSVVLVDADCAKPQLTRVFGAENRPGLLDLLKSEETEFDSHVIPTDIPGFAFLPAGTRQAFSSELLASNRMRDLCAKISARDPNRVIVFDSSPLLLASEAPILASQVGQIAVVVRANNTPRTAVQTALEGIDKQKPIGLILNQKSSGSHAPGYGYSYGHYGQDAAVG